MTSNGLFTLHGNGTATGNGGLGPMGPNILHRSVHTSLKKPGSIVFVSYCAGPVPWTCPGPGPVLCEACFNLIVAQRTSSLLDCPKLQT